MAFGVSQPSFFLFLLGAAAAIAQSPAPIVQPGAPGNASKVLTPATATVARRTPLEADIYFMQGMIHHHSQAVEMVDLLVKRGHSKSLQALGNRIRISQTDEMQFMKQWLQERGLPTTMQHAGMDHAAMGHNMAGHDMKGMAGMDMNAMPMMPGMLNAQQMKDLANARGAAFDRLFLTGMIQHHTGALIMVDDLFNTAAAGQDNVLYDFATDVDNTQTAEIAIMKSMLKEMK